MKMFQRCLMISAALLLMTGCASTGGERLSNDWRNCAAAGVFAGGLAGSTDDFDAVKSGAAAGAIIGSLVCAFMHKDEDNDGVSDDKDRCPGTFPGAKVDQNGCELDFDGDGVVDRLDECPNTVSGARVDARGCELDSDGDGVVDSKDQCPGTPAGAPVDENGCEFDTDNDGVVDSQDKCPDTAAGTPVDNTGCDLAEHYNLKGVQFEFDSAKLTANSVNALNDGLAILNRNSELQVEISGHTDSRGTEEYNQALSERRAKSVRDYLVAHGVAASRLTSRGYGESQPVADNATDQGRAQNRRVELRHK